MAASLGRPEGRPPGATAKRVALGSDDDPTEWAYSNEYSDGEVLLFQFQLKKKHL